MVCTGMGAKNSSVINPCFVYVLLEGYALWYINRSRLILQFVTCPAFSFRNVQDLVMGTKSTITVRTYQ